MRFLGVMFGIGGLALALAPSAAARPIDGAWGIGFGTGLAESGQLTPGLSLLRGYGPRHAWGLDVSIDSYGVDALEEEHVLFMRPRLPDSLAHAPRDVRRRSLLAGLRWRQYSRATEGLTTFLDLHLAATYNSLDVRSADFHREQRRYGGETGIGFGAEWFPRGSPVTLSVQTNVLACRLEKEDQRFDDPGFRAKGGEDVLTLILEFTPRIYLRACF